MATLADLKLRVVSEMTRDDLEDDLADLLETYILRAIEHYQGERFWFNYGSASANATSGNSEVAMPATMRVIDIVRLSTGEVLTKVQMSDILATSSSGTPTHYAEFGDGIYLFPTPASNMTLTLFGTKYVTPPAADTDSTVWTVQAYDLINARTKRTLYADKFRDLAAAAVAKTEEDEVLARLKLETERRNDTPLRLPGHFPTGGYCAYS